MGSRGSNCTEGFVSGQWMAEERALDPAEAGGGRNSMVGLCSSLRLASVESLGQESYDGKKKIFPAESGKYPGRGGGKLTFATWTVVLGTVVK